VDNCVSCKFFEISFGETDGEVGFIGCLKKNQTTYAPFESEFHEVIAEAVTCEDATPR
jgi:hypothetical protein